MATGHYSRDSVSQKFMAWHESTTEPDPRLSQELVETVENLHKHERRYRTRIYSPTLSEVKDTTNRS